MRTLLPGEPAIYGSKEHQSWRRKQRKAQGLCGYCKNKALEGKHLCEECYKKTKGYREKRLKNGLCSYCLNTSALGKKFCQPCIDIRKNRVHSRKASKICVSCGIRDSFGLNLCQICSDRNKENRAKVKMEAFNSYGGPKCICCKSEVFEHLTIEHIDNNGAEHRKSLTGKKTGGGYHFYAKLKKLGFPKEPRLEVLCYSCNFARANNGYCPCQTKSLDQMLSLMPSYHPK